MAAILFVDDESAIRDMLRMVLKLSGHVPMEAADAENARRIVQEQKPDLALVDIMMPGEDGFSLAKDLISVSIPVLFLTARTAVADRVRGLRMGAEDYILKPFEPEELPAVFDRLLADRQFLQVLNYLYPGVPVEAIAAKMRGCKSCLDFQKAFCYDFLKKLMAGVSHGFDMDWSKTSRAIYEGDLIATPDAANYIRWIKDDINKCAQ